MSETKEVCLDSVKNDILSLIRFMEKNGLQVTKAELNVDFIGDMFLNNPHGNNFDFLSLELRAHPVCGEDNDDIIFTDEEGNSF